MNKFVSCIVFLFILSQLYTDSVNSEFIEVKLTKSEMNVIELWHINNPFLLFNAFVDKDSLKLIISTRYKEYKNLRLPNTIVIPFPEIEIGEYKLVIKSNNDEKEIIVSNTKTTSSLLQLVNLNNQPIWVKTKKNKRNKISILKDSKELMILYDSFTLEDEICFIDSRYFWDYNRCYPDVMTLPFPILRNGEYEIVNKVENEIVKKKFFIIK